MLMFAFRTMAQVKIVLPEQGPPLQPKNCPVVGDAVSVMFVPAAKLAAHVAPQLIPAGLLVTVPVPEF
jgi:hypothetical protein